jgi:peptidoglycan hydrolase CwlO-like protein
MVFGWGKKKKSLEFETTIQEEKEIKLDKINSKVADIQDLRKKTIIAESKTFRKKIIDKLFEIAKIINELERDDLNVDDIDKHLKILVVRGKKQVIGTIKKENSEKLPDIKSYEDVVSLTEVVTRKQKRIGDALGRQSRVIHIFAKKYAGKLKSHLAVLNSDRSELQSLVNNFKKLNDDASEISEKIAKYNESKNKLETNHTRITDTKNSIEEFEKKIKDTKNSISKLKSGEEYLKYIETQNKLESLSTKQIQAKIDSQFTKISRPLSRYEYGSALDKPQRVLMEKLIANPFDVMTESNKDDIIKILSSVHKGVEGGSISVKDSEKSLASIDETIEMLDEFVKEKSGFIEKKDALQRELDSFNTGELKQKESLLTKTNTDKTDAELRISRLEQQIEEIKKSLPEILMDIEIRLRSVSAIKYHVME